jgi:hypothetical protein
MYLLTHDSVLTEQKKRFQCLRPVFSRAGFLRTGCLLGLFGLFCPSVQCALLVNTVVTPGTSTLSYTVSTPDLGKAINLASINYRIKGSISGIGLGTVPATYVSVSPLNVPLINGAASLIVKIGGTIGGVSPSATPVSVPLTLTTPATIDLTGDLDESGITMSKPAGAYTGSFTITAAFL